MDGRTKISRLLFHYGVKQKELSIKTFEQNRIGIDPSGISRFVKNPDASASKTVKRICRALSALASEKRGAPVVVKPSDVLEDEK